jgi:hypothetical protein
MAVALALMLAATSITLAVARGQTRIGGQVAVLCSGGGMLVVTLDAEGKPTGPAHLCPELAVGLFAALDLAAPLPERRVTVGRVVHVPARAPVAGSRPVPPSARGPPLRA